METKQVKYNEETKQYETIYPEDEEYENSITMYLAEFWSETKRDYVERWVTVPED